MFWKGSFPSELNKYHEKKTREEHFLHMDAAPVRGRRARACLPLLSGVGSCAVIHLLGLMDGGTARSTELRVTGLGSVENCRAFLTLGGPVGNTCQRHPGLHIQILLLRLSGRLLEGC